MDELLSIGDFSDRCGLSAKVLRSYASSGLLVPAAIDGSSGYRYYSAGQLQRAQMIALLRRAEVPIREITAFFRDPDPVQIDEWEARIVEELRARRDALAEARSAFDLNWAGSLSQSFRPRAKGFRVDHILLAAGATHIGGRESNQDSWLIGDHVYAVADGLGGMENGDIASRLALDTLADVLAASECSAIALIHACREANRGVWEQATQASEEPSMGTTLAALAVSSDGQATVAHVGDSRLYQLRRGQLTQLTEDHSLVAQLIRDGKLTAEQAEVHPDRHILTRALGVGPDVAVDTADLSCQPGDRLLLCTDGLYRGLSTNDLRDVLATGSESQQAAAQLVALAVDNVAEDNVTAVVIDVQ